MQLLEAVIFIDMKNFSPRVPRKHLIFAEGNGNISWNNL